MNQFVTKDDKHAMETFVSESLAGQVRQMLDLDSDEEDLESAMEAYRARVEEQFGAGGMAKRGKRVLRERPEGWDSDFDGRWEDQAGAWDEVAAEGLVSRGDEMEVDEPVRAPAKRGGARAKATTSRAATTKKAPAKKAAPRTRRTEPSDDELDDDEEEPAPAPTRRAAPRTRRKPAEDDEFEDEPAPAPARRGAAGRGGRVAGATATGRRQPARATRQTRLDFSQPGRSQAQALEISDDEVSDDFQM